MKKINLLSIFYLLMVLLTPLSQAQVTANKAIVYFKQHERPIQDVLVLNHSKRKIGIKAVIKEILNPHDKEKRELIPTKDLIVSPKRFILQPSTQAITKRTIRLFLKNSKEDHERFFSVGLYPELKKEAPGGKTKVVKKGNKSINVKVLTSVGLLIFSEPKNPVQNLVWERKDNKIIFTNKGNISVRLFKGQICNPGFDKCEKSKEHKRIYAGKQWEMELPSDKNFIFDQQSTQGFQKLYIE